MNDNFPTIKNIEQVKIKLKKAGGVVNKCAALSVKGKCSDEEWEKSIDEWIEAITESLFIITLVK